MIRTLRTVRLKSGERLRVAAITAPAGRYARAIRRFLDHKGEPWLTHVERANRDDVDDLRTIYYVGLLERRIVGNVMIVGDGRAGILGHVFTDPAQRRKGICTHLMAAAVEDFRASGALAMSLGTGYDSPPYHIYAAFGFQGVEPGNGHMLFESQPGSLDRYFAPARTRVAEIRWEHWAGLSLLYMLPEADVLRSHAYGVIGPVGFEGGFLRFQTMRERLDARARVLVTAAGSVVGVALCQRDEHWPGPVYTLDVFSHPRFERRLAALLRAVPLPSGAKIQAWIDRPSSARSAALLAAGFHREAILKRQLHHGPGACDVLVFARAT